MKNYVPTLGRSLSPLSLLFLTACGGSDGGEAISVSYTSISGKVVKGPLDNAFSKIKFTISVI